MVQHMVARRAVDEHVKRPKAPIDRLHGPAELCPCHLVERHRCAAVVAVLEVANHEVHRPAAHQRKKPVLERRNRGRPEPVAQRPDLEHMEPKVDQRQRAIELFVEVKVPT
eukprot:Amastigsp_a174479_91.p3 type:complete len:111 gc:universal Amastigsp_a174479_91:228-560(+)